MMFNTCALCLSSPANIARFPTDQLLVVQVAQERNALAAQLKEVERALEEEQHARRKGKKRLLQRAEGG